MRKIRERARPRRNPALALVLNFEKMFWWRLEEGFRAIGGAVETEGL